MAAPKSPETPDTPETDFLSEFPNEPAAPANDPVDKRRDWLAEFPEEKPEAVQERRQHPRRFTSKIFGDVLRLR